MVLGLPHALEALPLREIDFRPCSTTSRSVVARSFRTGIAGGVGRHHGARAEALVVPLNVAADVRNSEFFTD